MIQIPIEEVIYKIKEKAGISEDDINKKIEDKLAQLSGLISRNGAAHIIANELNVNLFESMTGEMQIKKLLPGMRNIETKGKVQRIFETREFKTQTRSGRVGSFILGDETGTIKIVLWNDKADLLSKISENDVVRLKDGYVRDNMGRKEIHLNDRSLLDINPSGINVGEVKKFISVRKKITELSHEENDVELLGTIVQVFDIKFFEICPDCGKRARQHQDGFMCEEHKKVTPQYSYVLNVVLDDGSVPNGTIRAVLFRNQAERLLGKTHEEILSYKGQSSGFESMKNELLGTIVKLVGKVTKNQMMDRLEFISQLVFPNPNPEEEIKRLQSNN